MALLLAPILAAQEPPAEPAAHGGDQPARGGQLFPRVDLYFPEGDFDFRLSRLVKNAFVEGQFQYNFVKGDLSAFLRYRYYGYETTYQIGVFDSVEFEPVEKLSNDFQRVRGGLLLLEWPKSYHERAFALAEVDRITSNKEEFRFSTNRTNTFLRLGYQLGTPDDERSNAIVGETRARVRRLFTAHREIGPGGAGATGALSWGFDELGADFDYLKLELEGLKRYRLPRASFLIHRLHAGTFLQKRLVRDDPELPEVDRYSIPRTEFFRLDGRENLKGLDERLRGTDELHTTIELFYPWFVDAQRRALGLEWQSWYWILYGGYGTIGFDRDALTDLSTYIVDVGVGFETSFRLKDFTIFLSGIVAQALEGDGDLQGRISVKSVH